MVKAGIEQNSIMPTGYAINNGFVLISDENHISTLSNTLDAYTLRITMGWFGWWILMVGLSQGIIDIPCSNRLHYYKNVIS